MKYEPNSIRRTLIFSATGLTAAAVLPTVASAQTNTELQTAIDPKIAGELHREAMQQARTSALRENPNPLGTNELLNIIDDIAKEGDVAQDVLLAIRNLANQLTAVLDGQIGDNLDEIRKAIQQLRETANDIAEMIANIVDDSIIFVLEFFDGLKETLDDPRLQSTANLVLTDFRGALNGWRTGLRISRFIPNPVGKGIAIGASVIASGVSSSVYSVLN